MSGKEGFPYVLVKVWNKRGTDLVGWRRWPWTRRGQSSRSASPRKQGQMSVEVFTAMLDDSTLGLSPCSER